MNNKQPSCPTLLKVLHQENFFNEPKSVSEILAELKTRGYNIKTEIMGVALIRVVRSKLLTRKKEPGVWKYIQQYPSTSNINSGPTYVYDLHPRIKEVAMAQFKNEDFKGAILNAFIEVVDQVKNKTGRPKSKNSKDLDGDDLMNKIFGCDGEQTPKIKFNVLADGLDKAEQRGLMYLFKGVVGVRDKKAHLNFIQNDPLKTIEYLGLASLLMRLLDENSSTE